MGLHKGHTNNPKGKPKGAKGKKTEQWEALGEFMTKAGAEKFANIMLKAEEDVFTDLYLKALNYFKPKISYNINESKNEPLTEIIITEITNEPESKD